MTTQQFDTVDVLRLEVEADSSGLANLVKNPSGELGGWGWVTPITGSTLSGDPYPALEYVSPGSVGSHFYTEAMPVTAAAYVAASWSMVLGNGFYRARFEWLDSAGAVLSSSTQSGYLSDPGDDDATVFYGPHQAPASSAYVRLRFDHYSTNAGAAPTAGQKLVIHRVTVATAATAGELGTTRTNLFANPSMEHATLSFTGAGTLSRVAQTPAAGTYVLKAQHNGVGNFSITTTAAARVTVTPGAQYAVQVRVRRDVFTADRDVQLRVHYYTATGAYVGYVDVDTETIAAASTTWATLSGLVTPPPGGVRLALEVFIAGSLGTGEAFLVDAVMVERADTVGTYFDGATPDAGGWDYAWTGTAHASTSTAVSSNLAFIEPVSYLNVIGPAHDLRVEREELNLGTVEGTIIDVALDPASAETLRPGRKMRLTVLADASSWVPIFTGELRRAQVAYDPRDTTHKRARISFTAVDNTAALANHKRPDGVETIDELPFVLEGCGVPWNVNGSGDQVAVASVVAVNESASAADQVAITRDSNLGRAWVDRHNVAQVWDADQLGTTVQATLDEATYSDLSVDYDTERCINYVTVKVVRIAPSGETEEVVFGPYVDSSSVATWGVRAQEFTVQWATASESAAAAFAAAVLAANATPVVRINSVTIPVRSAADLSDVAGARRALLDLYDLVTVSNDNAGVTSQTRITRLSHSITGEKWLLTLSFSTEGSVAQPQETPSPLPSRVSEWWPEVRMLHGAKALCPANFLVMDGGSFDVNEYPELAAHLTGLGLPSGVLPDYTDKFPIGAGTKALGTTGGSATKTIAETNLPAHKHGLTRATGTGSGQAIPRGSAADGTTTQTDNTGGGTPLDVMNPWRAVYFVIRGR